VCVCVCARAHACACVRATHVCVARRPSLQGFMCRVHKSPQAGVPERGTPTGRARTTKRPATAARPHPHPACPARPPRLPTRPRPRDRCVQVGRAPRRSCRTSALVRPRARALCVLRFAFCALRSAEARGSREQQRRQGLPVQTMPKRLCAAKTALAGTGPPRPRASGGSKRACAFDPARSALGLTGSWERCCALHRCCAQHTARVVCRAQLCVRPP
jgi:hypothetical protein